MTDQLKPGTRIRPKYNRVANGSAREIVYAGPNVIVYKTNGMEHAIDRRDFVIKFEVAPDFFEEGKTYTKSDTVAGVEHLFEVESVRENEGEAAERVPNTAFGRQVTIRDGVEVSKAWMTYTNWSWNKGVWIEKQDV